MVHWLKAQNRAQFALMAPVVKKEPQDEQQDEQQDRPLPGKQPSESIPSSPHSEAVRLGKKTHSIYNYVHRAKELLGSAASSGLRVAGGEDGNGSLRQFNLASKKLSAALTLLVGMAVHAKSLKTKLGRHACKVKSEKKAAANRARRSADSTAPFREAAKQARAEMNVKSARLPKVGTAQCPSCSHFHNHETHSRRSPNNRYTRTMEIYQSMKAAKMSSTQHSSSTHPSLIQHISSTHPAIIQYTEEWWRAA